MNPENGSPPTGVPEPVSINGTVMVWLGFLILLTGCVSTEDARTDSALAVRRALKHSSKYQFGQSRESLAVIEDLVFGSTGNEEARREIAQELAAFLSTDSSALATQFACRMLSVIGGKDEVPALTSMLAGDEKAAMALYVLEGIPGASVDKALRKALSSTSGRTRIGVINAIGVRRDARARKGLAAIANDSDGEVARAAITALGRIGGRKATADLEVLKESTSDDLRSDIDQTLLTCAFELSGNGQEKSSTEIYESLFDLPANSDVRVSAFLGLARARGEKAAPIIGNALVDEDQRMRSAALGLVREIPGEAATKSFASQLQALPPGSQALLLTALADRGDRAALRYVIPLCDSADLAVRVSTLQAMGRLGGAENVPLLVGRSAQTTGLEQEAARNSLAALRGEDVDARIVALLNAPDVAMRLETIRCLGPRSSASAVDAVVGTVRDPEESIRIQSLQTLGMIAEEEDMPALVDLLIEASTDNEREEARKAIVVASRRIPNPEVRGRAFLKDLKRSKDMATTRILLVALAQIGGKEALEATEGKLRDENPEVRDAAIRALAAWCHPEAMTALLQTVRNPETKTHEIIALRGYIRLLDLLGERTGPPGDKVFDLYREAFDLATRPDEKKQVLAGISSIRRHKALNFALDLMKDPELKDEAAMAAVKIVRFKRRSEISRDDAWEVMRRALAASDSEFIRDAADAFKKSAAVNQRQQ